jgi:hypothetical protein
VRRSLRNRAPSSVRDEDPTYEPPQLFDDDMLESKRSSRGKTTRKPKPAFDDAQVTPTHVERQSKLHEEEHLPLVTSSDGGKPPRKRAAVQRKASSEAPEESSWSHPKAMKKKTTANRSSTGNAQVSRIPYLLEILANYCVVMEWFM